MLETVLTIAGADGLSIVICAYNSVPRLVPTLRHLAAQRVPPGVCWEIVLVDNASTDGTAQAAAEIWRSLACVPLRIAVEPRLGLSHARACGLREARYELVSFVDDDNWVAPNWVQTVLDVMEQHPDAGACGGRSEAVFEGAEPGWFPAYQAGFAVGAQAEAAGDVSNSKGYLWGAGLTIRRRAWLDLVNSGFHALLTDRRGQELMSGGDTEMCYALRLAGWRLWYDPALSLRHFLPVTRLTFGYLRRLQHAFGASGVYLDPYFYAGRYTNASVFRGKLGRIWTWRVRETLGNLLAFGGRLMKYAAFSEQEYLTVPRIDYQIGRLRELLRLRGKYDANYDAILGARWIRRGPLA